MPMFKIGKPNYSLVTKVVIISNNNTIGVMQELQYTSTIHTCIDNSYTRLAIEDYLWHVTSFKPETFR